MRWAHCPTGTRAWHPPYVQRKAGKGKARGHSTVYPPVLGFFWGGSPDLASTMTRVVMSEQIGGV